MKRVDWTSEMDAHLISMTEQNVGARAIAAELGVDRGTVQRRRKLLGLGGCKGGRPRLYDDGRVLRLAAIIKTAAIAERLATSRAAAYSAIRRARLRERAAGNQNSDHRSAA